MKKKLLSTAIAAGMGMGLMSTAAQAVYVNAQGTGQVLLYPYYSADSGNDTYVQVVNTSDIGKAVKVRFVESKNSHEVLDFNLYLSPHDVWTGAVTMGPNGGAMLVSNDKSCTSPRIPAAGVAFRTSQYQTDSDKSIERTLEGHLEIIGMADIRPGSDLDDATTHIDGELPTAGKTCNSYVNVGSYDAETAGDLTSSPTGGLYGFAQLINVEDGAAAIMDATALENFSDTNLWAKPGTTNPSLNDADTDAILFDGTGVVTLAGSGFGISSGNGDAVSAVLMTQNIQNSYVVDPDLNAGTDWIVTFPTKNMYVNVNSASAYKPFTAPWIPNQAFLDANPDVSGPLSTACEEVELSYWDREEQGSAPGIDFSPSIAETSSLCYEANVITFNNTNVIGSRNAQNVNVDYTAGWMDLGFLGTNNNFVAFDEDTEEVTLYGLPAIGYMLNKYENGVIGGVLRNYMGASAHKETSPFGQ